MSVVRNYAPNPSAETATTGHTAVPGTSGTAAVTNPTVTTAFGTKVARCTWSVASTAAGGGEYFEIDLAAVGLVAGDVISAGWFHLLSSIGQRIQLSVEFRTNAATISTFNATAKQLTSAVVYSAATSTELKVENLTIPATCTKIRVRALSVAGTGYANWSVASYLQLDGLMVNKGATLQPYVDGDRGFLYAWDGVAHASTSAFFTPVISVTPHDSDDLLPARVDVLVTDLPLTAVKVSALQISEDGTEIVRDQIPAPAVGSYFVTDFEVPLGVPVTYQLQMYSITGASLGLTASVGTEVDLPAGMVIIQDPLAPKLWVQVRAEAQFADQLTYQRSVNMVRRGDETIALMGRIGLLENISLRVATQNAVDRKRLSKMLQEGDILVRSQDMPLPRCLYAVVAQPRQVPHNARSGGTVDLWDISGNEVSRTPLDVIEPVLTYTRFKGTYSTYTAAKVVYPTYTAAKLNPPPEV